MGVRSRSNRKRRRRAATGSVGDGEGDGNGGGVDLISSLNDDLLVRILDLVPDAENVVRTHALSRRWRGLWTGVSALRFDHDSRMPESCRSDAAVERYIAFVNGALLLRAVATQPTSVEDLAISFDISRHETKRLVPLAVEAAQGWISYAVHHAVKSFVLKLTLPLLWRFYMDDRDGNYIEHPVLTLDQMDNYAKIETMHLTLGGAELRLPASTVAFPSLIDLSLENIDVPAGGGDLLSRLVSSACCPHLQKLQLRQLFFFYEHSTMEEVTMLHIEADTLVEMSLESPLHLQFLELRTPRLQVLDIDVSFNLSGLNGFTVSAPRLENLKFWVQNPLHIHDVLGQLSSVGTLMIQMFSHGETDHEDRNDASIHLLQCCRSTRCLEVSFEIPKTKDEMVEIIKGRIPLLPYVTQLTIHIRLWELHSTGPGVACLLAQCSNIKYLSLRLCYIITKNPSKSARLCEDNLCHWKSHDFSLGRLQEVKFKNLIGTDCEFQFIQSILTKATEIQTVTISFDLLYWHKGRKHGFKLMPQLDGGLWTTCKVGVFVASYKWTRL